jgi:hypothetical protein
MTMVLALLMGLGLAAACGLRVFVPVLVLGVAARLGWVSLLPSFDWLSSDDALLMLAVATVLELTGYLMPGLDHALDVIASPAALVAGTVVTASMLTETDPWVRWCLAAIAGGGIAGLVQATTVTTRAGSTLLTGGVANPMLGLLESITAAVVAVVAMALPVLLAVTAVAAVLVIAGVIAALMLRWAWRMNRARLSPS